jgi:hypothetical protein
MAAQRLAILGIDIDLLLHTVCFRSIHVAPFGPKTELYVCSLHVLYGVRVV